MIANREIALSPFLILSAQSVKIPINSSKEIHHLEENVSIVSIVHVFHIIFLLTNLYLKWIILDEVAVIAKDNIGMNIN